VGSCRTTDDGAFRIEGLPTDSYRVSINRYDTVGMRQETVVVRTLTLAPDENRTDIVLGDGALAGEVSGRVLWKDSGAPIDSITIYVYALEEKLPGTWVAASTFEP
jgi:hypothetical protein